MVILLIGKSQLKLVDIRSPSSLFKDIFFFVIRDVTAARSVGIAHGDDQLLGGSQVQCLGALRQVRDSHVLLKGLLADQVEVALIALIATTTTTIVVELSPSVDHPH